MEGESSTLKCHKTYFVETLWVAASDVSCTYFSFMNFVNRAKGIWSSDSSCDVRSNLKRNEMLSSLTWKTLVWKKKQKKLVFRLKALFLLKNIFCLYFSKIAKLWPRKEVIFRVFVFWRYYKTLKWTEDHSNI